MSKSIDNKVVSMEFDNSKFEKPAKESISTLDKLKEALHFKNVEKGFNAIQKGISAITFNPIEKGLDKVLVKFTAFDRFTIQLYDRLANKIIDTGKTIASQTFTVPVKSGLSEYEEKMGAVQTIMASSKRSLSEVNKVLGELNTYADQTIYSFSDMTNSIGKFTNAGVELEDAVEAIKGISNEAALSGANAAEASRAMYNFAQALSSGSVKLIDWKSIENANMATVEFKDQLIKAAVAAGTLVDQGNGLYKTLDGKTLNAMQGFNDSLQDNWMTSKVLITTLKKYGDATDQDVGQRAAAAATEVKTFTMMLDTLKEALQSGWAESWEYIFGDFEKAKELWTSLSNAIGGFLDRMADARNIMLKYWSENGGRVALMNALINVWKALASILGAVRDGFRTVIPPMTGERLVGLTRKFEKFTSSLKPSVGVISRLRTFFTGLFDVIGIVLDAIKALKNAIMPLVKDVLQFFGDELIKDMSTFGGLATSIRKTIAEAKIFEKVFGGLVKVLTAAWTILKKAHTVFFDIMRSFMDGGWSAGFEAIKRGFKELVETIWETIKNLAPVQKVKELGIKIADKISEWPVGKAIVDFLRKIKDVIANSPVWNFCVKVVNGFIDMIQEAINRFRGVDTKPVSEFTSNVEGGFKPLEAIGNFFKAIWNGILKIWEVIGPTIKSIGAAVGTAFKNLYDGIKGVVNRSDMGDVGVFNAGTGLGLMMTSIAKFMLDLTSTVKNAGATVKALKTIVDGLKDLFKAMKVKAYAQAMKDCAISIALLAGSLFILSAIPSDSVLKATAALEVLFTTMAKMLKEIAQMNVVGGKGKTGIMLTFGAQIALLAGSIFVLVSSMVLLALLPYNSIIKGVAVIVLLMRSLSAEVGKLGKAKGTSKVAGIILSYAIFFQMLLIPISILSLIAHFDANSMWMAAGVILAIMTVMSGIAYLMAKANDRMGGNAKSIKTGGLIMSLVVGMVSIIAAITLLVGVLALANLAGAGEVITDAMLIMKDILDTLFKALVFFALVPGLLSKYSTVSTVTGTNKSGQFITKTKVYDGKAAAKGSWAPVLGAFIGLAMALIAVAGVVAVFGVVRKTLTQSEWEDAYQAVFLATTILGTFLVLFQVVKSVLNKANSSGLSIGKGKLKFANISLFPPLVSFVTAAAITCIAIASAAKMMSTISVGNIVAATTITAAIIALIIVLAKMGEKSKKFTSSLKAIGGAFQIFAKGAMYLAIGVGIVIASIGLLASMTGSEIDKVNENVSKLADGLRKNKQDIVDAVSGIATMFVGALIAGFVGAWTEASNQIFDAVVNTLATLAVRAPEIVKNVFIFIGKVLDGIVENAHVITDKLVLAIAEVIDGLATAIDKYHIKIIEAINKLIESVLKLFAGIWARLWGVTKEGLDDFYEDTKGRVKVIASVLMGLFIYKKVKSAKDSAFTLLGNLKKKIGEVRQSIRGSKQEILTMYDDTGKPIKTITQDVGTLKDYFHSGTESIKNIFKQLKTGIKNTYGKLKDIVTAHPVLTAITLVSLALKGVFDIATKNIEVITDNDKRVTESLGRVQKMEEDYQSLLKKRDDAYKSAKDEYIVGDMYLEQLRGCVDAQGKLIKGKEDEFLFLKDKISGYISLEYDKTTGLVEAQDKYNRKLNITKDNLEEIYRKQILQKQIEAAMETAEEAYKKLSGTELTDAIDSAYDNLQNTKKRKVTLIEGGLFQDDIAFSLEELKNIKNYQEYINKLEKENNVTITDRQGVMTRITSAQLELQQAQEEYDSAVWNRKRYESLADSWTYLSKAAAGTEEQMQTALNKFNAGIVTRKFGAVTSDIQKQAYNTLDALKKEVEKGRVTDAAIKKAKDAFEILIPEFKNGGEDCWDAFKASLGLSGDTADAIIEQFIGPEAQAIERIKKIAEQYGINDVQGLIDGILSQKGKLFTEWDDLTGRMIYNYAKIHKIKSPSKVFAEMGAYDVLGLIQGVAKKENALEKTYSAMAAGSLAAYTSAMSANRSSFAFTPMINPIGIQNGTAAIQSQLNGLSATPLGATLTSQLAASVDTSQIDSDNSKILKALADLLGGVGDLGTRMENLQIVMDTGATVGALAPGMDLELGRRAVRKGRGV